MRVLDRVIRTNLGGRGIDRFVFQFDRLAQLLFLIERGHFLLEHQRDQKQAKENRACGQGHVPADRVAHFYDVGYEQQPEHEARDGENQEEFGQRFHDII